MFRRSCNLRRLLHQKKYFDSVKMDKAIQVHREAKLPTYKWVASSYYDHPDGQDLAGKLSYTTKIAAAAGTIIGLVHLRKAPEPKDIPSKILRVSQVLLPSVAMAVVFTTVTYISTNLRKKDDQLNYVFGGAAAGASLGMTTRVPSIGILGSIFCAALGFAKKTAQLNNKELLPSNRKKHFSSYYLHRFDTSLIEDRKRINRTSEPSSQ